MSVKKEDNTTPFLKEAVSLIVGKQSEDIVGFLIGNKHVNEFLIAKKLDITINQTRNILYKLSDQGVVSSIRKKDKKKGWYTYFWKIEVIKALEFLRDYLDKRAEQIKHQIDSREVKRFYVCERCNIEYNEENALFMEFTCNECGNVFTLKDNTKLLKELKKNYDRFTNQISNIDKELEIEREKSGKKKLKEIENEAKEKKLKREAKKLATKKAKEKADKESGKKISKKVTKKTSKKIAKKVAKKVVKKMTKKVTKKIVKKTIKKVTKKTPKRSTNKLFKKLIGRVKKKTTKKVTRKRR